MTEGADDHVERSGSSCISSYPPIDSYAFLADGQSAALIGRDGAVESLCAVVSALSHAGRQAEAETRFSGLCARASNLGLYAEELSVDGMLGNFQTVADDSSPAPAVTNALSVTKPSRMPATTRSR